MALAGSLAGGITVGTKRTCYGEATANVATSIVRHGPNGTAAGYSTHSSEEFTLAATFTVSGTCQAVSGIILKGGREPGAISRPRLPSRAKTLGFRGGGENASDMQKRANSARVGWRGLRLLVGLALAGSLAGGITVGTKRTCYGEATAKVATSIVRHGPNGTAAGYSTQSDG